MKSSRRNVFQTIATAIAALAIRQRAAASSIGVPPELFADTRSLEAIGRAYLAEYGTFGIVGDISAALELDPTSSGSQDGKDLRKLFRPQVTQDFADGNIVLVQGWMLSRTEAQICASAALRAVASRNQ
jgi:hypothetical protein